MTLLAIVPFFLSDCLKNELIKIQSVSPLTGCSGKTLYIIGWGFSDSDNVVKINGIEAQVIQTSPDMLVVTLPDTLTTGKITVKSGNNFAVGPEYSIAKAKYYIKFKVAGTQTYFDICDPGYDNISDCASAVVPLITNNNWYTPHAVVAICSDNNITGSIIESWKGKTFSFTGANPRALFEFADNSKIYSSTDSDDQTISEMTITDITPDLSATHPNVYIATGTFKCSAATFDGDTVAVTDGEFSVRFTGAQ